MMQKTLKKSISCAGVGLHSGQSVKMTMLPLPENSGIVFKRTDVKDKPNMIKARFDRVADTRLCTLIANEHGVTIGTIEHLMSALAAAHIDNVMITLDGPEVPIMDGSAEPFLFLIDCAGIQTQSRPRHYIRIKETIAVEEDGKHASFAPAMVSTYSFDIDFPSRAIGKQSRAISLVNGNFRSDISRARTFGFAQEVEYLRSQGLARGGSLDNAIVVDKDIILNKTGLRFDDEFVRHKILDAIGDTYLAGMPIIGAYHGIKAGHDMNNKLVRALYANPQAFEVITMDEMPSHQSDTAFIPAKAEHQTVHA